MNVWFDGEDLAKVLGIITAGAVLILGGYWLFVYGLPGLWELLAGISGSTVIELAKLFVVLAIFGTGCWLVLRLWQLVIDAMSEMKTSAAKGLVQLVGGLDVEGHRKDGSKFRVTGIGLLGTLVIIICCVVVIYIVMSTGESVPAQ